MEFHSNNQSSHSACNICLFICRISFGVCGRFTGAELLSFSLAVFIVCIWVLTGHWLLMDGKLLIDYTS